jgi:HK97 family phage prohead protease
MSDDLLHRRMAVTADVRPKAREIDVLAVPYNSPAEVWDPFENRRYSESIAPDAFRAVKRRPNQVKVLRDHDTHRLIGSCRAVHPNRPDGLHATMKIAPTELGNESLALAEDGALHVSVGFLPDLAFDEWTKDRSAVVRHACELWEISLVPFPAYEEADVLAVRRAPVFETVSPVVLITEGTPRKDAILARLAQIGYVPSL